MESEFLHQRLSKAISEKRSVVLLLRGAHGLKIDSASLGSSEASGETRFDISGRIAIDGDEPQVGTVSVTSSDVASLFVKDPA